MAALALSTTPQATEIGERDVETHELNQVDGQVGSYSQTTCTC